QASAATASSVSHTTPTVTTTVANAQLVGHYTYAASSTWATVGPPGPMTETYDVASLTAPNAAGQSLEAPRIAQSVAGISGGGAGYRSDANTNSDTGVAHLMALKPAGT